MFLVDFFSCLPNDTANVWRVMLAWLEALAGEPATASQLEVGGTLSVCWDHRSLLFLCAGSPPPRRSWRWVLGREGASACPMIVETACGLLPQSIDSAGPPPLRPHTCHAHTATP